MVLHRARGMLELARGRDATALAAFRAAERLAGLLVPAHPRSTPMRAHMLQTLVRMGETARAEQALAGRDETGRGELRNALAALRLAQRDPEAATAALAPVLAGSAPVTNLGWMTQARHRTAHAALIVEILGMLTGRKREPVPGESAHLREPLTDSETRVLRYLRPTCPRRRSPASCPCR